MDLSSIVIGYHGCTEWVLNRVVNGYAEDLSISENEYDWLGKGIYFWENDYERAKQWAIENIKRKHDPNIDRPAVLGAVILPHKCLDLTKIEGTIFLEKTYNDYVLKMKDECKELPQNKNASDKDTDLLLRYLDCTIINEFCENEGRGYVSVRGLFPEGEAAYPGAGIKKKTHIQWAIRNPVQLIFFTYSLLRFFEDLYCFDRSPTHVAISLMGTFVVVVFEPFVQILLEFFNTGVEFLSQGNVEEFLLDGSVEAFCESICFRGGNTGFTVLDAV